MFTWYEPGTPEALNVFAGRSRQPLVACAAGNGYIGVPTENPDAVFETAVWSAKGALFLARSGNRRGAGFYSKKDSVVTHWWDEEWITVDPSRPWEMDSDGRTVRDVLDLILPTVEPEPWTTQFRLAGAEGDELRVILRAGHSDDATFDRLVQALGLPQLLADVAMGRTVLSGVEGAQTFEPDTLWGSFKRVIREEIHTPVRYPSWASPVTTWDEHRKRRSVPYLVLYLVTGVVLGTSLTIGVVTGTGSSFFEWKVAAFVLVVVDLLWPRRKLPAESSHAAGEDPAADIRAAEQ
jgi:hypothetical protein